MNLASHSVGRWEHAESQGLVEAMFSPEANIDDISEDAKQEFAYDSWQAFVDCVAKLRSDHKTHAYAQAAKVVTARVEEVKKIMCAKGESTPWKDSLPESLGTPVKAQEFFKIQPVADFMATDKHEFADAINEKTKLVIINSPSNPTGITYNKDDYQAIGTILEEYPDIYVATDDMYEYIYWGEEPFVSFAQACPDLFDRTITINGVSKSYAMTGWRIGYCGGPANIVGAMKKVQSQSTSNPSSISQAATIAALNGPKDEIYGMVEQYKIRHDYLFSALNDIKGFIASPGTGAFYLFPDVKSAIENKGFSDDVEFSEYLIETANVAVVPGSAFGSAGYIRLSYATSLNQIEDAVERISKSLD